MSFTYEEKQINSLFIDKIWHTLTTSDGVYMADLDGNWDIIITKGTEFVAVSVNGIGTKAAEVPYVAGIESIGIALKPGVFLRDHKGKDIVNSQHILNEGNISYVRISGQKFKIPDFETAEAFVQQLEDSRLLLTDLIVSNFSYKKGATSSRTLRRHVANTTGLSPHFFDQIQRAQYATDLLKKGIPIAKASSEAGYTDQAHMTKSLKRIIGRTPTQIISDNKK